MGLIKRHTKRVPKSQKKMTHPFCYIPIPAPVSNYSSHDNLSPGNDFYDFINTEWISTVHVPAFENDFGISEEVERCVFDKSVQILESTKEESLIALKDSFFKDRHTSVNYIHSVIKALECVNTIEDIVKHFSALAKSRVISIFNYQYHIKPDKKIHVRLDSNCPSLPISLYKYTHITHEYKILLDKAGNLFNIDNLSQIYEFEKTLAFKMDSLWNSDNVSIRGGKLVSKFPRFPWAQWFEVAGLDWKSKTIYYNSPAWIRYLGKVLKEVPVDIWRLYLAKIYILHALPYLPAPYDDLDFEFFGRLIQGQREKFPQMEVYVNTVYKYMNPIYSKIFWESAGDQEIRGPVGKLAENLVKAAKKRIAAVDWLEKGSRVAAIEKIGRMGIKTVRPEIWGKVASVTLDPTNCIKNVYDLGSWNTHTMFSRLGKPYDFWEEGIYRVNAYYFNETNEIMIPYGTCISPFYSKHASAAWNYGALGTIIGHEMCHGFDEDGKDFNYLGEKKKWWSRGDLMRYNKKAKALISLFHKQTVYGKHINGIKTLSENIADLGGVAIALEALKMDMEARGVTGEATNAEYREFFQSFATSWRTKYRPEKLKSSVDLDSHSPAFLRVNLVVSQLPEFYDAYGIGPEDAMYIPPSERISIF
jgi:predicted metalloendopeptidase